MHANWCKRIKEFSSVRYVCYIYIFTGARENQHLAGENVSVFTWQGSG